MVDEIERNIKEIISETTIRNGDTIDLNIFAERQPGGIGFSHPLVERAAQILEKLDIEPRPGPSTSELSAFIDSEIPAITLGLSHGSKVREAEESVQIDPIYKGVAQMITTLKAIDGGYCEES
jgi:hypothetical protein